MSRSEVPASVAEWALAEAQCLRRVQLVDERRPAERSVVQDLEGPVASVFAEECISHPLEMGEVPYDLDLAVQHDVDSFVPGVAPCRHGAARIGSQVPRLLFFRPAAEVERTVHPNRHD